MIIPDDMADTAITLKDQYFDLQGLSAYSALGVGTLRDHIRCGSLPCFKVKGKILVKPCVLNRYRSFTAAPADRTGRPIRCKREVFECRDNNQQIINNFEMEKKPYKRKRRSQG
jgi:hypothetical protein